MTRRIAILAGGTLGDIRPLIALGKGLCAAGFGVTLATHERFAGLTLAHGLAFRRIDGNPSDLLLEDDAALALDHGMGRAVAATARYIRAARPVYARMLESAAEVCRANDALIVSLASCWGQNIAAAFDLPCIWAPLQPITPTGFFSSPLLPGAPRLGRVVNRLSYALIELSLWLPWRAVLARWRTRAGMSLNPLALARRTDAPWVYGFSPHVAPPPADWPAHHVATGYWFLDDRETRLPADVDAFITAGEPPVSIGFGSMGGRRPAEDAALAVAALTLARRRGILIGGDEVARAAANRPDLLALPGAAHQLLFPRMAAVVHHGGAGTTAAGLRAGVPAVTVPIGVDQHFWGMRVAALGVGPAPLNRRRVTVESLAAAIDDAASAARQVRAAVVGQLIRAEDGVTRAVEIIQAYL